MRPQSEIQAVLFGMVHMPVQNEGVDAVQEVRNVIGIRIGRRLRAGLPANCRRCGSPAPTE